MQKWVIFHRVSDGCLGCRAPAGFPAEIIERDGPRYPDAWLPPDMIHFEGPLLRLRSLRVIGGGLKIPYQSWFCCLYVLNTIGSAEVYFPSIPLVADSLSLSLRRPQGWSDRRLETARSRSLRRRRGISSMRAETELPRPVPSS